MDLKPDNVILFGDGAGVVGRWKLCDFGISEYEVVRDRGEDDESGIAPPRRARTMDVVARRGGGDYQAPEVEVEVRGEARVGRRSDVWSFGCVFAEVLAFAWVGSKAVAELLAARQQPQGAVTDSAFHSQGGSQDARQNRIVKPEVLQWLDQKCGVNRSPPGCLWACCWAGHVKEILRVDPNKRPSAKKLVEYVNHLLQDAHRRSGRLPDACKKFRHEAGASSGQPPAEQEAMPEPCHAPVSPVLHEHPAEHRPKGDRRVRFGDTPSGSGGSGSTMSHHGWNGKGPSLLR